MAFCRKCGNKLDDTMKFCTKCGTQVAGSVATTYELKISKPPEYYEGVHRTIPVGNRVVEFPASMDAHIYYRRVFSIAGREMSAAFNRDYSSYVYDLDSFLIKITELYQKYRNPLIGAMESILLKAGVYDVSIEQLTEMVNNSHPLIVDYYTGVITTFNNTLQANAEKKAKNWSLLPTMFFSGLGGFIIGTAYSFAIDAAAEASIKNADVSPYQRSQIYSMINHNDVCNTVLYDYLGMYRIMLRILKEHGKDIWMESPISTQEQGLYQNLAANIIPEEIRVDKKLELIRSNPVNDDFIRLIIEEDDEDIDELRQYVC